MRTLENNHLVDIVDLSLQGLTLKRHIDATLGQGKVREAVRLPEGEDLNEWLAVNTVDFYNAISVLYSTLDEYCIASSCPIMSAGPKVIYRVTLHGIRQGSGIPLVSGHLPHRVHFFMTAPAS